MTAWDPISFPVDVFWLQGIRSPGTAEVRDGAIKNVVTKLKPMGSIGAITIANGRDLTPITITLKFTTAEELQEWANFSRIIDQPPGGYKPKALEIAHPIIADLGVTAVIVKGRTQLKPDDSNGWSVDLYFEEYRRPKPARSKPIGAEKKPGETALEKEIRATTKQLNELAGHTATNNG